jgi:hypothetical protein
VQLRGDRGPRPAVDSDRPDSAAIDARDQWVAFFGVRSSVATTTASICSSPIVRGSAWAWLVDQSFQTPFVEAAPPLADGLCQIPQLGGDFLVSLADGAAQDDPAALGQVLCAGRSACASAPASRVRPLTTSTRPAAVSYEPSSKSIQIHPWVPQLQSAIADEFAV